MNVYSFFKCLLDFYLFPFEKFVYLFNISTNLINRQCNTITDLDSRKLLKTAERVS